MTARSVFWAFAGALRPLKRAAAAKANRLRRKWPIVYSSWISAQRWQAAPGRASRANYTTTGRHKSKHRYGFDFTRMPDQAAPPTDGNRRAGGRDTASVFRATG